MNEIRTGLGVDIHAFGGSGPIRLGGVDIDSEIGVVGHSDADVLTHAICDALLGAAALGDIGEHFPADAKWRGADSMAMLAHVDRLLVSHGWDVVNVDAVVICEWPRVGPHRDAMRDRIASVLEVDLDRVSVKATTSDRLGFTGRGHGIVAQAVATIRSAHGP